MSRALVTFLLVLGALLARAATAQPLSASAAITDDPAFVDAPTELRVRVDGTNRAALLGEPMIDGCDVESIGGRDVSQTLFVEINGRRDDRSTRAYELIFRLTPRTTGVFVVPPIEVEAGGEVLRTDPIEFRAVEPEADPEFVLELTLGEKAAYVGQAVRGTLAWDFLASIRGFELSPITVEGGTITFPRQWSAPPGSQLRQLELAGQPVLVVVMPGPAGAGSSRIEIPFFVTPEREGTATIGPTSVVFDVRIGERPRRFSDSPFEDRSLTRRGAARAPAVRLDVRPLPAGAPPEFDGLVGEYAIESAASATSVGVGDPIELTVSIRGEEPLGELEGPALDRVAAFGAFKLSSDGWKAAPPTAAGERTFTTTIRAEREDVSEIPAIPLAYFSPAQGRYITTATDPIPLRVRPTQRVTAADALVTSAAESRRERLADAAGGILANRSGDALLVSHAPSFAWAGTPGGSALLLGPPALAGVAAIWSMAIRSRPTEAGRRRRAFARARRAMRSLGGTPGADACAALAALVVEVHGGDPAAASSEDAIRLAGGVDDEFARRLAEALRAGDAIRYGSASDSAALVPAARSLAAELKRRMR